MPKEIVNPDDTKIDANNDNQDGSKQTPSPDYITRADFDQALASARKEEKDKLYADKKKQDDEIRKLKEINTNFSSDMKGYHDFMSKFKSVVLGEEADDGDGDVDPSELTAKMEAYRERMQTLEDQQKKTTNLLGELHSQNKRASIEKMRRDLIESTLKENKFKFIPDIVSGNTPEEVMESIGKSAELYKIHHGTLEAENTQLKKSLEDQRNLTDAVTASHVPGSPHGPADSNIAINDLIRDYASKILDGSMTADDVPDPIWQKHSYKIQAVATQIAEEKLAEASKKTIPPRSHGGVHRTSVGYKNFSSKG